MCGIVGSNFHYLESAQKALDKIKHRGPDQSDIIQLNNFIIGANRLAIQDIESSNQPLYEDGTYMVYNGELWNGTCDIKSDGKWILSQYNKLGPEVFSKMDGMFALCILDNNKFILARDFIGEIPLYYYHENENFCFASEIKAFKELGIDSGIKQVPPGSTLIFENNSLEIKTWYSLPKTEIKDSKEAIITKFRSLLDVAVEKRIPKEVNFTTLLSGGIDSTIIAFLLKQHKPDLEAYTICLGNNLSARNSNDLYFAREAAKWLDIKLNEIIITEQDVLDNIEKTVNIIEDKVWTQVASGVCHILMAEKIDKKYKVVFSGGGSDEIFASYPSQKRWQWRDEQYDDARRGLIKNLHKNNIIRENKCLMAYSFELRSPFLDKNFVDYAINVPIEYRYENKRMKPLLRYAFPEIPEKLLWREKVCQGEGVGVDPILKENKSKIKDIYDLVYGRSLK